MTLLCCNLAQATTYYISPTGNNANNGTSTGTAWQTIARANGTFVPGDIVLFEGGQTFTGTLMPASSGTFVNRITFGSYGTGRATISSAAAGGLVINGLANVTVKDLIFRGDWQNSANTAVNNAANTAIGARLHNVPSSILLDNLKISGYGSFGIEAQSADSNITITRFEIHDNKDTGIEFRELSGGSKHTNVILSDGSTYRNRGWATPNSSGNGIRLASANGALIERCIAYENGKECTTTGGGPVGIWSWRSNNVIIQYCIAYRNGTAGTWDGGGFDIDGGDTNCIIQYNYSFENEGAGYLFAAFSSADGVHNSVLRYNLSVNDATKGVVRNQGSIHVWNASGNTATSMQNVFIYNNTVIQTGDASAGSCFQTADAGMNNVRVFNNLFIAGNGRLTTNVKSTSGVSMQGNLYYCLDDATNPRIRWGVSTYATLAAFRSATGQEMLAGNPVGLHANPNLVNATAVPPVLTAWSQTITQLNPWRLTFASPARNSSLSAASLIGASTIAGSGPAILHPGTIDLFGSTLPASPPVDMGMHELVLSTISIAPSGNSAPIGSTTTFNGQAYDGAGALISPQPTLTWSVNGGGTINSSSGVFTATATGSYTVTATGGALSGTATVTVTSASSPPSAPSGLTATTISPSQITLTWTDNATDETGFKLERSPNGSTAWTQIATPATNATSYADTGLSGSTTYYYRVLATNATGDSVHTSVANATTQAAITQSDINVTSGLTAHLAFDETSGTSAADSTGNGRTGTLQTGASFIAGKINNSVSLNGTSGYVAMPLVFNPGNQTDFTVTAWVRLDDVGSGSPTIIQQQDGSGTGRGWLYRNSSGRLATFLGGAETASTATLAIGGWYHVALIKTGSSLQLYVNGAANGSPATRTVESCIGAMRIGAHKSANNQYWNGMIDEVRFYNRALSGTELANVASWVPPTGIQIFRTTYGLDSTGTQDLLTPAGDGVRNLLKYAFNMLGNGAGQGSNLNAANSSVITANGSAGLPLVDVDGTGKLQITYIRRKAASNSGISYMVEFSDALTTWAVNPLATETTVTSIDITFERVTVTDNVASPAKRFARVRVTAP